MREIPKLRIAIAMLFTILAFGVGSEGVEEAPEVWVRIQLIEPGDAPYRVQVVALSPGRKTNTLFVGQTVAEDLQQVEAVEPSGATPWADLTALMAGQDATVQFQFEPQEEFTESGVQARIDVATSAHDQAIVRSITDHDPGPVIALRIPADPVQDRPRLLSIREDAQRRLGPGIEKLSPSAISPGDTIRRCVRAGSSAAGATTT